MAKEEPEHEESVTTDASLPPWQTTVEGGLLHLLHGTARAQTDKIRPPCASDQVVEAQTTDGVTTDEVTMIAMTGFAPF